MKFVQMDESGKLRRIFTELTRLDFCLVYLQHSVSSVGSVCSGGGGGSSSSSRQEGWLESLKCSEITASLAGGDDHVLF